MNEELKEELKEKINSTKEPYNHKNFRVDRDESHRHWGGLIERNHFDNPWDGTKTKIECESKWAVYIENANKFDILCSKRQIIKIR